MDVFGVVVVPHPVNRHGIYGLAYGRLGFTKCLRICLSPAWLVPEKKIFKWLDICVQGNNVANVRCDLVAISISNPSAGPGNAFDQIHQKTAVQKSAAGYDDISRTMVLSVQKQKTGAGVNFSTRCRDNGIHTECKMMRTSKIRIDAAGLTVRIRQGEAKFLQEST